LSILKYIFKKINKNEKLPVSHDPSENILICLFAARKTFLLIL